MTKNRTLYPMAWIRWHHSVNTWYHHWELTIWRVTFHVNWRRM